MIRKVTTPTKMVEHDEAKNNEAEEFTVGILEIVGL